MEDYFALYDVPLSFFPDEKLIRERFYAISRDSHPDLHASSGPSEAMKRTMMNNEAYRIISNFDKRLPYILELKGLMIPGEKYDLKPAFLMEMLELNEELDEARVSGSLGNIHQKVQTLSDDLEQVLKQLCEQYDKSGQEELLPEIKDLYYRRKYLQRLVL